MNKSIVEITDWGMDLIEYIVSRKFAHLDEERRQSFAIEIETLRTQLRTKTEEELRAIYRREKRREEREQREMAEWDQMSFEETLEFNRRKCCAVNFALWAKKAHWMPDETVDSDAKCNTLGRSGTPRKDWIFPPSSPPSAVFR